MGRFGVIQNKTEELFGGRLRVISDIVDNLLSKMSSLKPCLQDNKLFLTFIKMVHLLLETYDIVMADHLFS